MIPQPPPSTLFPYTTLFRSDLGLPEGFHRGFAAHLRSVVDTGREHWVAPGTSSWNSLVGRWAEARRSEEHTSELQSRENLVCRLLLEKKNNISGLKSSHCHR